VADMVVLFLRFTGPTCNSNFTIRKGFAGGYECDIYPASGLGLKFDHTQPASAFGSRCLLSPPLLHGCLRLRGSP
jgi:hypothetical protein